MSSDLTVSSLTPSASDSSAPSSLSSTLLSQNTSISGPSEEHKQTDNIASDALQGVASSFQSKSITRKKKKAKQQLPSTPQLSGPSSSTSNSTSNQQPPIVLDLTRVFYKAVIISDTPVVLFIPASQLPEPIRNQFLAKEIPYLESANPKERLTRWKQEYGRTSGLSLKVYEVTNVARNEIKGIKSRLEVYKMLGGRSIEAVLFEKHNLTATDKSIISSEQVPRLTATAPQRHRTQILSNDDSLAIMSGSTLDEKNRILGQKSKVVNRLHEFKTTMTHLIDSFGGLLCPKESMRLLWDMLSQSALRDLHLQNKDETVLSQSFLEYWEKVHRTILDIINYSMIEDFSNAQRSLKDTIQKLKDGPNLVLINSTVDLTSLHMKLQEISSPLLNLLRWANKLNADGMQEFANKLLAFFNHRLDEICHLTIYMDRSRRLMRDWLESHASLLERYLVKHSATSPFQDFLTRVQKINRDFQKQDWLQAYQEMQSLITDLTPYAKAQKLLCGQNNLAVRAPNRKEFISLRCLYFLRELLVNFKSFITDDNMYQVVSEEAFSEMQKSYNEMQVALTNKTGLGAGLFAWAKELKQNHYPELYSSIKEMKTHWDSLKAIRKKLAETADLNRSLQKLFLAIENEDYQLVPKLYLEASKLIAEPMQQWAQELQHINRCIAKMQDTSLLMLMDPSLPPMDIPTLRNEFNQFNERLRELIQPMTSFYNAFQQLICIDHPQTQSVRNSNENISLRFTENGSFRLALFQTDPYHFEILAAQIARIRQQSDGQMTLEIEEEVNAPIFEDEEIRTEEEVIPQLIPLPIPPPAVQRDELTEIVADVFQSSTKTRVIIRNLTELLQHYNAAYSQKFGKGDHIKFYVNGVLVVLPKHDEWKPGTLRSIQNKVLTQLRGIVRSTHSGESQ